MYQYIIIVKRPLMTKILSHYKTVKDKDDHDNIRLQHFNNQSEKFDPHSIQNIQSEHHHVMDCHCVI